MNSNHTTNQLPFYILGKAATSGLQFQNMPVNLKSTAPITKTEFQAANKPFEYLRHLWPENEDTPNSARPFGPNSTPGDEGQAVRPEHPFKSELELYRPLEEYVSDTYVSQPPPQFTPLTIVLSELQMDALVRKLASVREIVADTTQQMERDNQDITCLVQITTMESGDYIVETRAARDHVQKLNLVFTDPRILKVFHGSVRDVLWLHLESGIYIVGMFDTTNGARPLQMPISSLRDLLNHYSKLKAIRLPHKPDWHMQPLSEEVVGYAPHGNCYLVYVWRHMRGELVYMHGSTTHRTVYDSSQLVCLMTNNKPKLAESAHLPVYQRSGKIFDARQMMAFQILFNWREHHARDMSVSTQLLLPDNMLLAMAERLPCDEQDMQACCSPMPLFIQQHLFAVQGILLTVQATQFPESIIVFGSVGRVPDHWSHRPASEIRHPRELFRGASRGSAFPFQAGILRPATIAGSGNDENVLKSYQYQRQRVAVSSTEQVVPQSTDCEAALQSQREGVAVSSTVRAAPHTTNEAALQNQCQSAAVSNSVQAATQSRQNGAALESERRDVAVPLAVQVTARQPRTGPAFQNESRNETVPPDVKDTTKWKTRPGTGQRD